MSRRRSTNERLPEPPSREDVIRALDELEDRMRSSEYVNGADYMFGFSAASVAWWLGVEGARRLGNGAVKGSWSGYMSASLRVAPRLTALAKEGVVVVLRDADHRNRYRLKARESENWSMLDRECHGRRQG